jgi:hypothetical protein
MSDEEIKDPLLEKPEGTGAFQTPKEARDYLQWALKCANAERSKISTTKGSVEQQLLDMQGMSGYKYRHLLNNLCSREGITYAEVGTWMGSTFLCATYGNEKIKASTCDNWSEFGGPKQIFLQNYQGVGSFPGNAKAFSTSEHVIFDQDFRTVDFSTVAPIDIYFFDGPHSRQDQRDGLVMAWDALAPVSIVLVDDWNWGRPRKGTWDALNEMGADIHYQAEIFTPPAGWISAEADPKHGKNTQFSQSPWHNGAAMFVIKK